MAVVAVRMRGPLEIALAPLAPIVVATVAPEPMPNGEESEVPVPYKQVDSAMELLGKGS